MKPSQELIGKELFSVGLNMKCKPVVGKVKITAFEGKDPIYLTGGLLILGGASDEVFLSRAECKKYIEEGGR